MTRIDEIRANLRRGIVGMPSDAVAVAQDLLDELDRTTADLAVAVEVARERGEEVERLRAVAGQLAAVATEVLALRDEWLEYGGPTADRGARNAANVDAARAALDTWRGGDTDD